MLAILSKKYCNIFGYVFSAVFDRVRYYPDDIGCCLPSAYQFSQTLSVDVHIHLLFYFFEHIPQPQVSDLSLDLS